MTNDPTINPNEQADETEDHPRHVGSYTDAERAEGADDTEGRAARR